MQLSGLLIFPVFLLQALFLPPSAEAVQPIPPRVTWHWQLRGVPSPSVPAQVVDFDVDVYRDRAGPDPGVAALRQSGKEVICYFSTQYENWRADMQNLDQVAQRLGQKLKGNVLDDWPGERFINTRSQYVRDLMQARMVRAKKQGCTAVEPDNVDFFTFKTGFNMTKKDAIDYMRFLSDTAHRLDLKIGLKNADGIAAQVEPLFDFAVVEECAANEECDKYSSFVRRGKAVLQAEYSGYNQRVCNQAKRMGFSLIFITNGNKAMNGKGIVPCR